MPARDGKSEPGSAGDVNGLPWLALFTALSPLQRRMRMWLPARTRQRTVL
ncbi:hypothetical protein [Streptomyces sp. NPDC047108]